MIQKLLLPLALLFAVCPAFAQAPFIETFEVRLHNLDVVVTDANGNPVNGLGKDDFVVLEDGIQQEITNFSEFTEGSATAQRPARAQGEAAQPATTEVRQPRKLIFFVDELSLHPASRTKLLKSAMSLMKNAMKPGDTAAVVRPFGENTIRQDFTGDVKAVEKALREVFEESHTRVNTQTARELMFLETQLADSSTVLEKNFAIRVYADIARRRVEQRIGQIRSVVTALAGMEGKKSLVLITASLAAHPGKEAFNLADMKIISDPTIDKEVYVNQMKSPDLTPLIAELGETAAANGVTIYALQPDTPLELATGSGSDRATRRQLTPADMSSQTLRPMPPSHSLSENFFGLILDNTEITMKSLAEKTGGKWFRGDGSVDDAFQQVVHDLRSYYSLAYRAKGDDRARRVEVRVKDRPELRIRTRSEVVNKSTEREMTDLTVASLVYPRHKNELGISGEAGNLRKGRSMFTVTVDTLIPMDKLTFLAIGDDKYRATFTVHYAAVGDRSDFAAGQEQRQEIIISQQELVSLAGKSFHYRNDLVIPPGKVKIGIGVLDTTSKLSGFHTIAIVAK